MTSATDGQADPANVNCTDDRAIRNLIDACRKYRDSFAGTSGMSVSQAAAGIIHALRDVDAREGRA